MAITSSPAWPRRATARQGARRGEPLRRQVAALHDKHLAKAEGAAATRDIFMDVIVLLSVLMFLALVSGVGVLVLQTQLHVTR